MSRWKASGIHLAISSVIGLAVFALLFFVWYPGPLFTLTGGDKLILLLIGVDVVIGPVLTLAIFKAGKPGLKFDLTVISILQAVAMVYGLTVTLVGRPAYLVFDGDNVMVVHANAINDDAEHRSDKPEYQNAGFGGPRTVALDLPSDPLARGQLTIEALQGHALERMPRLYGPYEAQAAVAARKAGDLAALEAKGDRAARKIGSVVERFGPKEQLGYLPLIDGASAGAAILTRSDGRIVALVDVDPR
jgi:hypothetical protein